MAQFTAILILAYLLAIINGILAEKVCNVSTNNWQSCIGILVSPIISKSMTNEVEVYWSNVNFESGEKIVIIKHDPRHSRTPIIISTTTPDSTTGVKKTGVQIKFPPSLELSFVPQCLFSMARQTSEGKLKEINCVKTEPTWMKERRNILGSLRMSEIFIPGTHDSASYVKDNDTSSIFFDFAVTQDMNILGQLIHGARYLDIRAGHYPNSSEIWWTNHGPFYRSVSLKTVIDQVTKFLDNTEEIVIMDIREFPVGFDNISVHEELVSYLESEFRSHFLSRNSYGWDITLNDIWSSGKKLIIGYENTQIVEEHASMWPSVQQQWGNVRNIEDLYQYLDKIESSDRIDRVRPRSAMAELTPNFLDVITNRLGSLCDMAYNVNFNVTNWYSTIWQYSANIVAVDYIRGTGIIETAIKANENRHLYCRYQ